MNPKIQNLLDDQLAHWELAKNNYAALDGVRMKSFRIGDSTYRVQFNPARILSSAAKVDAKSIQERKCFLCLENRPAEQKEIPFGSNYQLLVNPYPIFPRHLTIPDRRHIEQRIAGRFEDMLDLADAASDFVIFYNGPKCGASAPDHAHFQAGNKGFLPLEEQWRQYHKEQLAQTAGATLYLLEDRPRITLLIEATDKQGATALFQRIYDALSTLGDEEEPMMNILAWKEGAQWIVCVFPRQKHRPSCFTAEGDANLLISPASVDMGGVFITPREKDFEKITAKDIEQILREVSLSPENLVKLKAAILHPKKP